MAVLITFLTSIIGAFVGVYLKELFSDIFFKKRRMRELRSTLIKNIVKFFSLMKIHANHFNGCEIHRHRLNLLKMKRNESGLPQATLNAVNQDISGIFNYGKDLAEKDEVIYNTLVEIRAEIISTATECSNYLERHLNSQLEKTLDTMFQSARTEAITVTGYKSLEYLDLVEFQNSNYLQQLQSINNQLESNQKKYLKSINEILFS